MTACVHALSSVHTYRASACMWMIQHSEHAQACACIGILNRALCACGRTASWRLARIGMSGTPYDNRPPCSDCGQLNWGAPQPDGGQCKVFMLASLAYTVFQQCMYQTEGCGGSLRVAGIEYGLLRANPEWAFAPELLQDWGDRLSFGNVTFTGFFRDVLQRYKGLSAETKVSDRLDKSEGHLHGNVLELD